MDPFFRLNEEHFTFHLQYKHSGTFANRKYEELSNPKNLKMCDPILVTLLNTRPHNSQSSRENATPSRGTSPLASYKEVIPPGIDVLKSKIAQNNIERFMGLNVDLLAHSLSDINEEVVLLRYSSPLQNLLLKPSAEM